jgi:tRNA threonylcarbamoyladenosine biosynthesis protein TsaE
MSIILHSIEDTDNFARNLVPHLQAGDLIELRGDLGSGKTTLARSIIRKLSGNEATEVTSPTFNIVHLYEAPIFTIWHFDLYRIKHCEELIEIGIDEALSDGLSIIEWPDIAEKILPQEKLVINLSCGKDDERMLSLEGYGKWLKLIRKITNG